MKQPYIPMDSVRSPLHENLVGVSDTITELNNLIHRIASSDLTTLITGESGTGKDIVAKMLHRYSPRSDKPFIKVNCPAIPEAMMESELFGYERGAFTGAHTSKPGRLELAHLGVLFLDEVAETSYTVQGKLLQVLDNEPIIRIGGEVSIPCDVRIVAATNINLEHAVHEGHMREDLYYRLSEICIHIPPLRDHAEDIPLLTEHFNYNLTQRIGRPYQPIAFDLLERMQEYSWPGNIRELAACVKKYIATGDPNILMGQDVAPSIKQTGSDSYSETHSPNSNAFSVHYIDTIPLSDTHLENKPNQSYKQVVPRFTGPPFPSLKEVVRQAAAEAECTVIQEALRYTLWNRRKAAKLLDVSYSTLLRRIEEYGIGKNSP